MYISLCDDLIISGSDDGIVNNFIPIHAPHFSLKDLGVLSYFLGVEGFLINMD